MEPQMSGELAVIFAIFVFVFLAFSALVAVAVTVITALVYCKVFSKAGFNWALGLLMLAPGANIVMLFYLAFADWPVHQELRQLKQRSGGMPA